MHDNDGHLVAPGWFSSPSAAGPSKEALFTFHRPTQTDQTNPDPNPNPTAKHSANTTNSHSTVQYTTWKNNLTHPTFVSHTHTQKHNFLLSLCLSYQHTITSYNTCPPHICFVLRSPDVIGGTAANCARHRRQRHTQFHCRGLLERHAEVIQGTNWSNIVPALYHQWVYLSCTSNVWCEKKCVTHLIQMLQYWGPPHPHHLAAATTSTVRYLQKNTKHQHTYTHSHTHIHPPTLPLTSRAKHHVGSISKLLLVWNTADAGGNVHRTNEIKRTKQHRRQQLATSCNTS